MLLDLSGTALDPTLADVVEGTEALFELKILLHGWMVRVVLREEGTGSHKGLVLLLRYGGVVGRLRLLCCLLEVGHGARHLCDHEFHCGGVESVRFFSLEWEQGQRIVDLLPRLPVKLGHDQVLLLWLAAGLGSGSLPRLLSLQHLQVFIVQKIYVSRCILCFQT